MNPADTVCLTYRKSLILRLLRSRTKPSAAATGSRCAAISGFVAIRTGDVCDQRLTVNRCTRL
ncbi:hypothetical protein C1X69_22590 [Pseudomonas sp. FW305-67]|nr:hypothetical protein C1X70_21800 [Pseudomonas sp. FW305-53]PMY88513.1 hypothetical protein C1X68_02085 [Pseudomonas sp. FW303-C2]PMY90626.1 hypothetical protein C1X67_23100 [Pseudomonas sp. FW305-62]PNA43856.1 hypothetical protein C1X71_09955 [Pseudomonas sp. FW306-2-2C-A10BC]PNA86285.1 hypothetical protein C1X66_11805 [Pseudomonas sp. MPR-R3B]PNB16247.1 hypothetical protein C1X69_22590 [Pseudomonas sp. FW305-67]